MRLPVAPEYLEIALNESCLLGDLQVSHCRAGKLQLPTGQLIACDPLIELTRPPFETRLPQGAFRVTLSIAQFESEERVAFATIHLQDSNPVRRKALNNSQAAGKNPKTKELGYPVDSAIGCFVDAVAVETFLREGGNGFDFDQLNMTNIGCWSWGNTSFGDANLISFTSGYGDGSYITYAGYDEYDKSPW